MPPANLQLRPMTAVEWDGYRDTLAAEYAAEHVRAGNWTEQEALSQALLELAELLPDGVETAGMHMYTGLASDGAPVGVIWVSERSPGKAGEAMGWVYDIRVVADQRRRGHGRAMLAAVEQELRRLGVAAVGLNVFGTGTPAHGLYQSAGYQVVTQQMRKVLDPTA